MIPAFRVGDLQDFDTKRTGDKLGKAGRRPGAQAETPVGRPSALEEALAAELSARTGEEPLTATQPAAQYAAEAIERDGYHPGLAAELSVQYGGPQRSWDYVVRTAAPPHRPRTARRGRAGAPGCRTARRHRPGGPARARRRPRARRLPRPQARRQPRRLVARSERRTPETHRPHPVTTPSAEERAPMYQVRDTLTHQLLAQDLADYTAAEAALDHLDENLERDLSANGEGAGRVRLRLDIEQVTGDTVRTVGHHVLLLGVDDPTGTLPAL
ncbi:hypothetical protein ACFZDK_55165 [Streptomyces sp. NPDC007901]|uniref:hypothetical protein n=1 Tax=Streptomyces sp. NPDC007901 TaxID=3364785 RepID=UPI0036EC72A8